MNKLHLIEYGTKTLVISKSTMMNYVNSKLIMAKTVHQNLINGIVVFDYLREQSTKILK